MDQTWEPVEKYTRKGLKVPEHKFRRGSFKIIIEYQKAQNQSPRLQIEIIVDDWGGDESVMTGKAFSIFC